MQGGASLKEVSPRLQQHIFQFKNALVQARAYVNSENTGHSYNLRSMAENIDVSFKDNNKWFQDYTNSFNKTIASNSDVTAAHRKARSDADEGRLRPGTNEFKEKLKQLQEINNWDVGAALKVKAHLVHTETSLDLGKLLRTNYGLHIGADFRDYIIVPDGNYFINPADSGHNLHYTSYGFFVQASKRFLHDKLQLSRYRSVLLNNRLFVDGDVYYNFYSNFIAQIEAGIPTTTDESQIPAYLYDRNKQGRYRLWTNSKTIVHNYGAGLEVLYLINDHYSIFGNASYQTLKRTKTNDGLEDGFNTPQWMVNGGVRGNDVYKKIGFNVIFKYQSNFYYQSFLINGNVPAIFIADAMVQYSFANPKLTVKIGGANVLNRYYYSILGGPQIGGFYYTTFTYAL